MIDPGHIPDEPVPPTRLQTDLKALYRVPISVEPRVDATLAALARERTARAARRTPRLIRWGLVAAAGLALGVSLTLYLTRATPASRVARAEDVNRDGVVDILDALVLERSIQAAGGVDVNGDGSVDRRDVDRVAMAAVALKGG